MVREAFDFFFLNFIFGLAESLLLYVGFSLWRLLLWSTGSKVCGFQELKHVGSVIVARGFQRMGSVVVEHKLRCSLVWGILAPWVGIESMSPALAGGFLTSGPPAKPWGIWFCIVNYSISTFNNRCVLATSLRDFQILMLPFYSLDILKSSLLLVSLIWSLIEKDSLIYKEIRVLL